MVIQSNMTSKAITDVWGDTVEVFQKYNIPIKNIALQVLITENTLQVLLIELNNVGGSSSVTCIKGG
ncbi:hypothetical protein ACSU6B_17965 [Neobacillus sp. C211]|uniref:hypothetical protein n=1 Tax=unclassified Neobacillus TaxID=2675272 RepID=UPI00397CEB80